MWCVELISGMIYANEAYIIANVIKFFSAAIIAQSLLNDSKVRILLFRKYSEFKNDFEERNP